MVIAFSTPGPGVIQSSWIKTMATDPIIFACANPTPEIWPWEAKEAGAAIVATGRSDFPNQVNNSLCFPGIFRGVLDVRASRITDEMCFAAAQALASCDEDSLDRDHILPKMDNMMIYPLQAAAVGMQAQAQGLAKVRLTYNQLLDNAVFMIASAQAATDVLMNENCIPHFLKIKQSVPYLLMLHKTFNWPALSVFKRSPPAPQIGDPASEKQSRQAQERDHQHLT